MKNRILLVTVALLSLTAMAYARGTQQTGSSGVPTFEWWLTGDPPPNLAEGQKVISDYTESKIGVRVEFKWFGWGDSSTRQTTMINSGEYWDVWSLLGPNYYDWSRRGVFADITDSLPKHPGLTQIIPQALWDGFKINGRIYAVPTYKDSAAAHYVMWDEALVRKYNINVNSMKTMADYDKALRAIKAGEGTRYYPIHAAKTEPTGRFLYMLDYDQSFGMSIIGVKFSDPNMRVVNMLEDPEFVEYLRYFYRWYQDGIINPDAPVLDQAPINAAVGLGQGWTLAWDDGWAKNQGWEHATSNLEYGPVYTTETILAYNAMSANSRNVEAALKFLELANTDRKLRDMLAYGIEGDDFEYVTPTTIKKNPRNTWSMAAYQQATFFIMSTPDGSPNPWDEVRQLNDQAKASTIFGFAFDRTPIQNEFANCTVVWDRFAAELFTGAANPDMTVPQALAELKANGFDRIIAEAQRQIDAWRRTR
ncbi:MAG: ABC transporter substrate-binding protein [Treponema sp.]|jgi:putative aldouronate transport system substrate-binding protein|nr:ABC transporter substrate-binding protein [Treponema sp.]